MSPAGSFDTELGLSLADTHVATSACGPSRMMFVMSAFSRLLCSRIFGPLMKVQISFLSSSSLSRPAFSPYQHPAFPNPRHPHTHLGETY